MLKYFTKDEISPKSLQKVSLQTSLAFFLFRNRFEVYQRFNNLKFRLEKVVFMLYYYYIISLSLMGKK